MTKKITELFAFVVTHTDGDEGIIAMKMGDTMFPFIGADQERVEQLKPLAETIAKNAGLPLELRYFVPKEKSPNICPACGGEMVFHKSSFEQYQPSYYKCECCKYEPS